MNRPALAAARRERDRSRWIGPLCAMIGVFGLSFKAILVKLAFAAYPVDALTLLTLRMLYSAPLFCLMAWWASRDSRAAPIARADWTRLGWLAFIGYYVATLLDFIGLQYITASLERLVLYLFPTFVVILSALLLRKPITGRSLTAIALSYAGIALVFHHEVRIGGDMAATFTGGGLVLVSALLYALYLVQAGDIIHRLGSLRFAAWIMLAASAMVVAQFVLTRPWSALDVPAAIHWIAIAMAVVCTALPTWLIAESVRRMGANAAAMIGAIGPVFTIGLGAMILGEPIHALQLAGAALVLIGVLLVTLRSRASETADTV